MLKSDGATAGLFRAAMRSQTLPWLDIGGTHLEKRKLTKAEVLDLEKRLAEGDERIRFFLNDHEGDVLEWFRINIAEDESLVKYKIGITTSPSWRMNDCWEKIDEHSAWHSRMFVVGLFGGLHAGEVEKKLIKMAHARGDVESVRCENEQPGGEQAKDSEFYFVYVCASDLEDCLEIRNKLARVRIAALRAGHSWKEANSFRLEKRARMGMADLASYMGRDRCLLNS